MSEQPTSSSAVVEGGRSSASFNILTSGKPLHRVPDPQRAEYTSLGGPQIEVGRSGCCLMINDKASPRLSIARVLGLKARSSSPGNEHSNDLRAGSIGLDDDGLVAVERD